MFHLLNLTEVLQKRNILPLRDEKKKKYFQLRRKDFINAQKSVDNILSAPDRRGEKLPPYTHFYNSVLINRWEAHSGAINYMLRIPEPLCYASCSLDKTIKIWSLQAKCWGKVTTNLLNKSYILLKFQKKTYTFLFNRFNSINSDGTNGTSLTTGLKRSSKIWRKSSISLIRLTMKLQMISKKRK